MPDRISAPLGKEVSAGGMWSSLARSIYVAEFVLLAVPVAIVLGHFAMMLGAVSGGAFLISVSSALFGGTGPELSMAIGAAIGVLLAALGLMSFWIFFSLSFDYILVRREALPQAQKRYRRGLFFAALPMPLLWVFASLFSEEANMLFILVFSGLTLFVPVIHLGLALNAYEKARLEPSSDDAVKNHPSGKS